MACLPVDSKQHTLLLVYVYSIYLVYVYIKYQYQKQKRHVRRHFVVAENMLDLKLCYRPT